MPLSCLCVGALVVIESHADVRSLALNLNLRLAKVKEFLQ